MVVPKDSESNFLAQIRKYTENITVLIIEAMLQINVKDCPLKGDGKEIRVKH